MDVPRRQPPPPDPSTGRSLVFILMMLLYFYGSGPNGATNGQMPGMPSPRDMFREKMARQRSALDVLNTTRWGDFAPDNGGDLGVATRFLNLTGFRETDEYAWKAFGPVKDRVGQFEREVGINGDNLEDIAVYGNVTGITQGQWVKSQGMGLNEGIGETRARLNLSSIAPAINWAYGEWNRNITSQEGKILMRIEEKNEDDTSDGARGEDGTDSPHIREASATLTIQDETSMGDGWEMRLHGVHWPHRGALLLTTTSDKFSGIFGLPHLATNKEDFESSQRILNRTLNAVLEKKEKSIWIDLSDPWSGDNTMPVPHCEYVVYVQIHPLRPDELGMTLQDTSNHDLTSKVEGIESELRFPTGAPNSSVPPLKLSLVIFSPDCGFVLESKGPPSYVPAEGSHLQGYKQEVFVQRVKKWTLIWAASLFGQVILIRMQMKEASTPSTVSRISLGTIGMMVVVDVLLFIGLMLLATSATSIFPTASLAAFGVSLSVGMGFRFLAEINNVQAPQRRERERERAQAAAAQATQASQTTSTPPAANQAPQNASNPSGLSTSGLPLPVSAPRTNASEAPIIIPSDQDIDAEIAEQTAAAAAAPTPLTAQRMPTTTVRTSSDVAASYGQGMMALMCFFFLTINSAYWPPLLRTIYVNTVAFIYLSFWTPQIYRNVMRNCRKALLWKFVVGQSVLRLFPFAYFYLKEDNVLFAETSGTSMAILAGWVWIQVWILAAQEVLGPRFGLPKGWLPEAWDYHPILREDDVEGGGMPIGLVKVPGSPSLERVKTGDDDRKKPDSHTRSVDCAICMNVLEVPVVPAQEPGTSDLTAGSGGMAAMLARRMYMVTPCRHVFHSACLEGWMRFRLQCPICRENLPAL